MGSDLDAPPGAAPLTPTEGGLAGRAAAAHDEAAELINSGADVDEIIGAEQLAAALTKAALTADN
jgi:hypothetical protein